MKFYKYDDNNKFMYVSEAPEEFLKTLDRWTATEIPDYYKNIYCTYDSEKQVWIEDTERRVADMKKSMFYKLWKNYKDFQLSFVDAEDLIMANTLALVNKPKGTAVRDWAFGLWSAYYQIKEQIEKAVTVEQLEAINISCEYSDLPYSIKELNLEAT